MDGLVHVEFNTGLVNTEQNCRITLKSYGKFSFRFTKGSVNMYGFCVEHESSLNEISISGTNESVSSVLQYQSICGEFDEKRKING